MANHYRFVFSKMSKVSIRPRYVRPVKKKKPSASVKLVYAFFIGFSKLVLLFGVVVLLFYFYNNYFKR